MSEIRSFPSQTLPFRSKTKKWRKQCLDWADSKTFFNYNLVRNSVINKKINYDLLNGKLYMSDMQKILNPNGIKAHYIPDSVQHFPIINSKLDVLRGEESKRVFDYRVVVTNPTAISQIENNKKQEWLERTQELLQDEALSEEDFMEELEKLEEYYTYEWQDLREMRANALLNHYVKEYNMPVIFNAGFMDALTVGEEIYQCDILGGEPTITKLNPLKVRVFKSGYSNKIEDADMIILEDYWSPGKVIDAFYDVLTQADIKYIEELPNNSGKTDEMENINETDGFILNTDLDSGALGQEPTFHFDTPGNPAGSTGFTAMPYDLAGNVRVLKLYWKSRRRIKKVKSFDPVTGEEIFDFYPEDYIIDKEKGEEEEILYINEAWEGTKIGSKIYVNMRPRPIQYNRLSNPSRCHFGITGSVYNLNDNKPFSLVDRMKPYNYLYNVIHDRLNKAIASNWGTLVRLDFSKMPRGWDVDKWMYYAKTNNILVEDSFNEGTIGAATGKLSGAMNNASSGGISLDTGNYIQQLVNILEYIKEEMSEVAGISKQREGQVSNRETVGGIERATMQSSHITEWLFLNHDDVRKRTLECFLETAKIALRGKSKKFQYILPDTSKAIMDIEGDEFSEADYGLITDNSEGMQEFKAKLDTLAQAALQNQSLGFGTIVKLFSSSSLAEKQRMIEKDEAERMEQASQQSQAEMEAQQAMSEMNYELEMAKLRVMEESNIRDNESRMAIAELNARTKIGNELSDEKDEKLNEDKRQFDSKFELAKEQFNHQKQKDKEDQKIKREQIRKQNANKQNNKNNK